MKDSIHDSKELDDSSFNKSLFHLKTLCDVSHVLIEQGNIDSTLRNFILMTMGSFGVVEGFVFMHEENTLLPEKLITFGVDDVTTAHIEKGCHRLLVSYDYIPSMEQINKRRRSQLFPAGITYVSVFNIAYACHGIVGLGPKIVGETYNDDDLELLETLIINLATTLKNVRSTEALKSAFEEVSSINQAKTKVINHLSHELKTPISLLVTAMSLMQRHLSGLPQDKWIRTFERAGRSIKRLSKIQRSVEDIMQDRSEGRHNVATRLLNECSDILESLAEEQVGDGEIIDRIRKRIDEIYLLDGLKAEPIDLGNQVQALLKQVNDQTKHRNIDIDLDIESEMKIRIPQRIIDAIVVGLLKNAVENTPDEGHIDISIQDNRQSVHLVVQDYGTGIAAKHHEHIFSGFYPTQETDKYATMKPYNFNAGGKGTDLMRIKIFSERYGFKIDMNSTRCKYIPTTKDICPGKISLCNNCRSPEDCHGTGTTRFTIMFPSM